jgi:predicted amidohydrolase
MSSSTLMVSAVQFELRAEADMASFARHVTDVVQAAASEGAELVVLPELATTGLLASHPDAPTLTVADLGAAYRTVFPPLTGQVVELLRGLAMRLGITLLGGSHLRLADDGTYRNTAHLVHPDGRTERQDKLHLTPQEKAMGVHPGDDVLITQVGAARVGVQICADIEFPEINRYLAVNGVEVVLCPSLTWNTRGANRVRYGAHARAMENQSFVVVSPLVGSSGVPSHGAIHGTGAAIVTGPLDRTLGLDDGVVCAHTDDRTEGWITATLDLDLLARSRANPEPPGLSNMRPDLYAAFGGVPVGDGAAR